MGKAETIPTRNGQVDEKLMKPFTLGWTREVVKRVLAKSPTCDIYYFTPDGKKLRSLREVKAYLTDGLNPDCFSFKREIFGVDTNFETVRDANYKRKLLRNRQTDPEQGPSGVQPRRRKIELLNQDISSQTPKEDVEYVKEAIDNIAQKKKAQKAPNNMTSKKKRRNTLAKVPLPQIERKIFKRAVHKQKRQGQVLTRKKVRKVASRKNEETENAKEDESESKVKAEAALKKNEKQGPSELVSKNAEIFLRSREKSVVSAEKETKGKKAEGDSRKNEIQEQSISVQTKNEEGKEGEESTDLKSIVQKNIGKYRKLREKQKMKLISAQLRKSTGRMVNNSRAESFLQNRNNYLKPLQKGWRRELVYRSNCTKAGLQADVYYFHPNGKKFRSSREIMDNPEMISGLSIEFFTFRKEAVGCGEPLEVIRSARITNKH